MKRFIIIIIAQVTLYNLVLAQIPHPERYQLIYGNRDGTPMAVQLGDTIQFPIWGVTDWADSVDTVATMFDPLKSADIFVPRRLGGGCTICPDAQCSISDPIHHGDSTTQSYMLPWSPNQLFGCYFDTFGDTVQMGYFLMSLTNDSSHLGQIICPFAEGRDPANGGLLWGFNDGLSQVVPVATYGCLYFTTCNAVPGDANGDGVFNAIDIVYGVNYLKGSGSPPQSWDCPGHGSVYVGADANGNCVFNGLDITYCVNYLKGYGPAPRRCPSC
jgi:hypothetical protein